jgi:2-polyprenyl-3-methyl-5-hydroxy-6-metoxy-1,4-benzoquinol methylase
MRMSGIGNHFRSGYWNDSGIGEGMRVLDVGAGGGTIAQWFAQHVSPSGSVLAVDLDPRFIMALDEPNLEARQMDLFADEFPRESFDVVHARCLLEHLPQRASGLERLIAAARPGGLVAVGDAEYSGRNLAGRDMRELAVDEAFRG